EVVTLASMASSVPDNSCDAKTGEEMVRQKRPGGTWAKANSPSSSDAVSRRRGSLSQLSLTTAPTIFAPDWSTIFPLMLPDSSGACCAAYVLGSSETAEAVCAN